MEVIIKKYERQINRLGDVEYFYKVHKVPGGKVLNTFFVPVGNEDLSEAEKKVIEDVRKYLSENDLKAINNF